MKYNSQIPQFYITFSDGFWKGNFMSQRSQSKTWKTGIFFNNFYNIVSPHQLLKQKWRDKIRLETKCLTNSRLALATRRILYFGAIIHLKELEERGWCWQDLHGYSSHLLSHVGEMSLSSNERWYSCCLWWSWWFALPSVCFPSVVIRLVSEPPDVVPGLQLPHVTPALVVLQPGVEQRLVYRVSLT